MLPPQPSPTTARILECRQFFELSTDSRKLVPIPEVELDETNVACGRSLIGGGRLEQVGKVANRSFRPSRRTYAKARGRQMS